MSGWVILVPFVLLGIFLSVRWLGAISVLVLVISGLVIWGSGDAGPGTYAGWASIGFVLLLVSALLTMWMSAGAAWLVRKFVLKKS